MQNQNPIPFTIEQLVFFRKELKNSEGDFDVLMLDKDALKSEGGSLVIKEYEDKKSYKEKYLTGIYEPLQKYYNTTVPYVFWGLMYAMLPQLKRDRKQKFHLILKAKESIAEKMKQ